MKKYELTDQIKTIRNGHTLHQIRALIDIPRYDVKAGDLGGWIETENNLAQKGDCWVGGSALVYEHAQVKGNALVDGNARVSGYAWVRENARVYGSVRVSENAWVGDNAWVSGNAWVRENAWVKGNARVNGNARVRGNARVMGRAHVQNGVIKSNQDYLVVGPIGSRDDYTTFCRTKAGIWVCCGCFSGSIDEFLQAVKTKHKGTRYEQDYIAAAEFAKIKVWGAK